MLNNFKICAVIPAKGGSSYSFKNIRFLCGKPLIAYSIEPAQSDLIDEIIVATDSSEIKKISLGYDKVNVITIPDSVTTLGCNGALRYVANMSNFDAYVLLQPTDLFKRKEWIEECINTLYSNNYSSVLLGSKEHKNFWKNDSPLRFWSEYYADRQVKEPWIREDSGMCCAIRCNVLRNSQFDVNDGRSRLGENPHIICKDYRFFDIHDEIDLYLAEKYLEKFGCASY